MKNRTKKLVLRKFVTLLSICLPMVSIAQCDQIYASILGSILEDEKGYSLVAAPDGQFIYVGGIKKDSAAILKLHIDGELEWSRTFDVVPGKQDHIHKIFVDAEGMIGVAGTSGTQTGGGTTFAMRYNPNSNLVLWANEYVTSGINYCMGMIEIQPGGNYLMSNNPQSPNVAELFELDKTNGTIITTFSKHYDMGSSEAFYDFVSYNGSLYASGRFSDGGSVAEMRNTVAKIDNSNGNLDWLKLGHRNGNTSARLYGFDILIVDDYIYTVYSGDDNGSSIDVTHIFLQKTDLQGNLLWIKEYNFPGPNDWVDEMIYSNGGFVILGRNRTSPSDLYLFKTDTEGRILWSYAYDFYTNDNATPTGSVQSQLIEASGYLFFTAYTQESGPADMILVKANLDGQLGDTCFATNAINPQVSDVNDPVFYDKQASVNNFVPQRNTMSVGVGKSTLIAHRVVCDTNTTYTSNTLTQSICQGAIYEGYTDAGIYTDTFLTISGCDSIRILELQVVSIISDTIAQEICPGQQFEGYTDIGIFQDTFSSSLGCDSVRWLQLSFALPTYTNISKEICEGSMFEGYSTNGFYTDTFQTVSGCDSIRTIQLQVKSPEFTSVSGTVCDLRSGGHTRPGTYIDTLSSVYGCDSIRTLILSGASIYIPNVFSPNGDGLNDIFKVFAYPEPNIDMIYFGIFDRFGNMAYQWKQGDVEWTGKDKTGKFYNPGVFAFVMRYQCQNEELVETGTITLIR